MPPSLLVDNVLVTTPVVVGGTALKMAAIVWRVPGAPPDGVTLLLAHGNGNHKEYWQPTVERLLLYHGTSEKLPQVREVWALDWQDHGDSAVANEAVISDLEQGVSLDDWATAIAAFVQERLMSHQLVLVGHSAGGIPLVCSMLCFPPGVSIPYKAFVLIEPPMHDRQYYEEGYDERLSTVKFLRKALSQQPTQYESPAAAYAWLATKSPWKFWDDRVRRLYVEKALRALDPQNPNGPQVVKCQRKHEIAKFERSFEPMFRAMDHLALTCEQIPYHFVYGDIDDFTPRVVKDNAVDASRGRKVASDTRIPKVGHMIPQMRPDALGDVLRGILDTLNGQEGRTTHRL